MGEEVAVQMPGAGGVALPDSTDLARTWSGTLVRDATKARRTLETLFCRVDLDHNGQLDVSELSSVFGDHAQELLAFCDQNNSSSFSCEEWVTGVLDDTEDWNEEEFQAIYGSIFSFAIRQLDQELVREYSATPQAAAAAADSGEEPQKKPRRTAAQVKEDMRAV